MLALTLCNIQLYIIFSNLNHVIIKFKTAQMKAKLLIGLLLTFIISSYSMEKRRYSSGDHIQKKLNAIEVKQNNTETQFASNNTIIQEPIRETKNTFFTNERLANNFEQNDSKLVEPAHDLNLASDDRHLPPTFFNSINEPNKKDKAENEQAPADSCDVITLKDGSEILGKVTEIGIKEIKYKKCDNPNGPTMVLEKSSVFMIKYPNGSKDVITTIDDNNSSKENVNSVNQNATSTGLSISGWMLIITGVLVFWIVSILFGVLLAILGAALVIAGFVIKKR